MLIYYVIGNGLACDCGVCRVLIITYHQFRKIYSLKWVTSILLSVLYLIYSIDRKLLFSMR